MLQVSAEREPDCAIELVADPQLLKESVDIPPPPVILIVVRMRWPKFVLVLALACSIGLHWVALQSLAWTSMLADNLCRDSLVTAVTHTFDGRHPCPLCKAIADGKKSEKKSQWLPCFKTLEFPPASEQFELIIPARPAPPARAGAFAKILSDTPPTPPPRPALA
jgi:hypothetical protein